MITIKNYATKFIRKLSDFIEDITADMQDDSILWFRGHTNASYKLLPGIYRRRMETSEIKSIEDKLISHFQARNYHLIPGRLPQNNMEWLCIMQHYNTATRLLDWTENAFTAFLFALEPYFTKKQLDQRILPCVWVLKPIKLNKLNGIDHIPNIALLSQLVPSHTSNQLNLQKIKDIFVEGTVEYNTVHTPLAVFSPYNNERIRAQSGVFTLFPFFKCGRTNELENNSNNNSSNNSTTRICPRPQTINHFERFAMEEHPECGKFLKKYVLLHPFKIYTELKRNGFKHSSIYPEMQVLSEEIEEYILKV